MKRLIAFGLILALLPALLVLPAAATTRTEGTNTVGMEPFAPRQDVTAALRDCVQRIADMAGEARTVAAVKELHDYSDNPYYVCELQPAGYVIADGSSGTVTEYSPSALSPYLSQNDALIYLGPTYCYSRQRNGALQDLIYGDILDGDELEFITAAQVVSNQLHTSLAKSVSPAAVQISTVNTPPESLEGVRFAPREGTLASATTNYYILNGERLKKLTTDQQMGYLSGGVCGYIATGLALYWLNGTGCDEAVNDFAFLQKDHKGFWGPDLTRELRSYGTMNGSSAVGTILFWEMEDMCDIIDKYAKTHSLTISYTWRIPPFSGFNSVKTALRDNHKPVILFGMLNQPTSTETNTHAVLAYGYNTKNEIIVHYGWSNRSEVLINERVSTFGSSIEITGCTANTVTMTDVSSNNWAYRAAQYCGRYQILSVTNGKYRPNDKITRGEFVQALYVLSGSPEVKLASNGRSNALKPFTDIALSSSYYCAAAWAVEKKIMAGTSPTTLSLNQNMTREQMATFFKRFSENFELQYPSTSGPTASSFPDYKDVSAYARNPMNFCTTRYLIKGSDGKLKPQGVLTRAEAGQVLYACSCVATRTK